MSDPGDTGQDVISYDTAARCRALAATNLRESGAAWALAESAGSRDPGLSVYLKEMALQAQGTARAAALAACVAEGGHPGGLAVRLLAGRVETGLGDKARIVVPGRPEPLTWHSGDIARQTRIPAGQLDGREVSFVAEEDADEVRLYGFEAVAAAPGPPARSRSAGEWEGRARAGQRRHEPPGGTRAPRHM